MKRPVTQVQLHHCNVKVEQRTGQVIICGVQANSFQIIGRQMSLKYSWNNVRFVLGCLGGFLELCCQLHCGLFNTKEVTVELV